MLHILINKSSLLQCSVEGVANSNDHKWSGSLNNDVLMAAVVASKHTLSVICFDFSPEFENRPVDVKEWGKQRVQTTGANKAFSGFVITSALLLRIFSVRMECSVHYCMLEMQRYCKKKNRSEIKLQTREFLSVTLWSFCRSRW